jgi:protein TonB
MRNFRLTGSLLGALSVTLMFCFMAPLINKKSGEPQLELLQPVQISPLLSPVEKPKQRKIIPKKIFRVSLSHQKKKPIKEILEPVDILLNPLKIEAGSMMAATLPTPLPAALEPGKINTSQINPTTADIYQVVSIDIPPRLKRYSPPLYPPRAKGKGVEGKVVVRCVVSARGSIQDVKILQAEPAGYFERAALNSVKKWTFVPAKFKGEKVAVYVDIPLLFSLD